LTTIELRLVRTKIIDLGIKNVTKEIVQLIKFAIKTDPPQIKAVINIDLGIKTAIKSFQTVIKIEQELKIAIMIERIVTIIELRLVWLKIIDQWRNTVLLIRIVTKGIDLLIKSGIEIELKRIKTARQIILIGELEKKTALPRKNMIKSDQGIKFETKIE
jgi:hypothetical protein